MKNSSQNIRWNIFRIVIGIFVAITIINACRKIDRSSNDKEMTEAEMRQKFFTIKPGTDPIGMAIAASVKRQDDERNLVPKVAKKAGYPMWDKARVSADPLRNTDGQVENEEQQVFIPFVQLDSNRTNALLAVKISGGDTLFRLEYASRYTHYGFDTVAHPTLNSRTVFNWFTVFDYSIFGHNEFDVLDERLIHNTTSGKTKIVSINQRPSARITTTITVWVTYMYWSCCENAKGQGTTTQRTESLGTTPCPGNKGACNVWYEDVPVEYWFDDEDPEGSNGWYGPAPGSGGGAGPCPGCSWEDTNPCEVNEQGIALTLCNLTWQPVIYAVPDPYDPDRADSVRVDDEILDSFPCVYHLIKDTLYNVNKVVQHAMQQFFAVNMYNHVYFEINWAWDCNTPFNAYTKPNGVRSIIFGQVHWTDTIQLNPCFLRTASKEKIISVLLHEPIHAFISWCIKEYKRTTPWGLGLVDSNYLKQHFGIYWEWLNQRPYEHEEDHDLMVYNFLQYMSDIIMEHSNPNAPLQLRRWVADKLAAGGLQTASAWGTAAGVTDTCNIYAVDYWGRFHKSGTAPNNPYYPALGCRTFSTAFRDSLQMLRGDSCQ